MEFTIVDALLTSVIGIGTVMVILAIIAVLIIIVSKVIRAFEGKAAKSEAVIGSAPAASAAPTGVPMPEGMNEGEVELIETDEKTAAVIMALVSHNSGIPLNRLSFKSIRLMDDEQKGAETK